MNYQFLPASALPPTLRQQVPKSADLTFAGTQVMGLSEQPFFHFWVLNPLRAVNGGQKRIKTPDQIYCFKSWTGEYCKTSLLPPYPPKQPIANWQTWIKVRKNTVRPNRSLCILVCLPLETGSTGFHDAWAQAGPADQRAKKKKKMQGAGAICYIHKMIPP